MNFIEMQVFATVALLIAHLSIVVRNRFIGRR